MSYHPGSSPASAMRLRASQSGATGLHIPLKYIAPLEEGPGAAAAHQQVFTPGQESPEEGQEQEQHGQIAFRQPPSTLSNGRWNPDYTINASAHAMTPLREEGTNSTPSLKKVSTSDSSSDGEHSILDRNGYKVLLGKERWGLTIEPFTDQDTFDEGRPRSARIPYLEGLRGIIALQTLLWLFFRTFAPAIVTDIDLDGTQPAPFTQSAPAWQNTLRKALVPLLCDGSTQAAMYIILLGRTGLQTFIERRQAVALAGACFRRPIRILVPVALSFALISVLTATNGFKYANVLASDLNNQAASPPAVWENALEYFNSLLSLLYQPYAQRDSRAVNFIPLGRIAWFVDVAFQQIFVMVVFAFVLPFTIFKYKVIGFSSMILLSAWVGRWSWYTITGLVLAEFSVVYRSMMPDKASTAMAQRGQRRVSLTPPKFNRFQTLMTKLVPLAMIFIGVLFKYVWAAAAPQYQNKELLAHANVNTGKLSTNFDPVERAFPRYDDWFLCTGLLVLIELSDVAQNFLSSGLFVYLGRLGFSIALISGTIMISLGGLLHNHLVNTLQVSSVSLILWVEFLAMIPCCLICADTWSRLVDDAGLKLSHWMFHFARN